VHSSRKFIAEHLVDHAMALDPVLSSESLSYDIQPEMGLSAGAISGMAFVQMGFVGHIESQRGKCLVELLGNPIAGAHVDCLDVGGFA
jgi:hypothetical protein